MDALNPEPPEPLDLGPQEWGLLRESHAAYTAKTSPAYDEVLDQVSDRIRDQGSIGKADIGALLFWKRLRADTSWVRELMALQDSEVRRVTEQAVLAANDSSLPVHRAAASARGALSPLPGFAKGDALASALLLAAAPQRMAVYDRRAHKGLDTLGLPLKNSAGRFGRYMELVEALRQTAARHGDVWSARDVDVALYWLGGKHSK
ncbi:hypothetical protein [Pseudarthrobacter sp. DSP2-3-2b1]|uniref:hypothetical protein n=1 Tax=Pseudarthrobacter sp. DSP2-3-2b1 TaxID=2804661 RepID=UPI003CEDDBDF